MINYSRNPGLARDVARDQSATAPCAAERLRHKFITNQPLQQHESRPYMHITCHQLGRLADQRREMLPAL